MTPRAAITSIVLITLLLLIATARAGEPFTLAKDTGYRGIWYQIPGKDGVPKYAGGFATYPQQHAPIAINVEKLLVGDAEDGAERSAVHRGLSSASYPCE